MTTLPYFYVLYITEGAPSQLPPLESNEKTIHNNISYYNYLLLLFFYSAYTYIYICIYYVLLQLYVSFNDKLRTADQDQDQNFKWGKLTFKWLREREEVTKLEKYYDHFKFWAIIC